MIGPTRAELTQRSNPTPEALQRLAKGPRNPMPSVSGRVIEMDSPAGAFECLKWGAQWDEEYSRWAALVQEMQAVTKGTKGPKLKGLIVQSKRTQTMCGFYAAKSFEIAGALYQRHGMDSSQVPESIRRETILRYGRDADVYVWRDSEGNVLTPREWSEVAARRADLHLEELDALGGVVDWGKFDSPEIPQNAKQMSGLPAAAVSLLVWSIRAIVMVGALTAALAVLDATGFMALIAPNAWATRESYQIALEALDEAMRACKDISDPIERSACLEAVADEALELSDEANERAQTNALNALKSGLGSIGILALIGAGGLMLYLNRD